VASGRVGVALVTWAWAGAHHFPEITSLAICWKCVTMNIHKCETGSAIKFTASPPFARIE
jgi:hypothetical protein